MGKAIALRRQLNGNADRVIVPLSRVSMCCLHMNRVGRLQEVTTEPRLHVKDSGVVYGKQSQTVRASDSSDAHRLSAGSSGDGAHLRHLALRHGEWVLVVDRVLDYC